LITRWGDSASADPLAETHAEIALENELDQTQAEPFDGA
jgi:hypothetical protein